MKRTRKEKEQINITLNEVLTDLIRKDPDFSGLLGHHDKISPMIIRTIINRYYKEKGELPEDYIPE